MSLYSSSEETNGDMILHTGSPHYLHFTNSIASDIVAAAREIRYSERFKEEGINVSFIEVVSDGIRMRTYEKGVEDETLSCGTGVTAAAIGAATRFNMKSPVKVSTRGGDVELSFVRDGDEYRDIVLFGPAEFVFKGEWPL